MAVVSQYFSGFSPSAFPTDTNKITFTTIVCDRAGTREKSKVIIPDIYSLLERIKAIEEEVKNIPKVSR
ncbi:hypothetical protein [Candidatus Methanodesulfokora washburnensis]|jgi:hypothetical protein|uniref:Uncharacterized protein n=1 Tax=Candidatus Methanodesulfokora washburnensis TaxID=2478471 RepID=A0A3R9PBE2_9CREN|nr:hypothetical protein [Candidatus Methanodesulfokores washburnensis]RSN71273.1 hypothetical protein D6D85_16340 [Candidatus Methanodesulfokores washburnensis]